MSDQRPKQIRATITPAAYTAKMIVVVVTPKPRFSVTAAIAGISINGSLAGVCAALRSAASGLPA